MDGIKFSIWIIKLIHSNLKLSYVKGLEKKGKFLVPESHPGLKYPTVSNENSRVF